MIVGHIKIRDKEYILKNTLRTQVVYYDLFKRPEVSSLSDFCTYFYSLVVANNKEFDLPLVTKDPEEDCFLSVFDEDPGLFDKFVDFLKKVAEEKEMFYKSEVEEKEEGKNNNEESGNPKRLTPKEIYTNLVLTAHLDPKYVLDEMEEYEISIILGSLGEGFKMEWEMTRFLSYSILCPQSKSIKRPTDIIKFSWEEDTENTKVSMEDYNRLVNKAKSMLTNKAKK